MTQALDAPGGSSLLPFPTTFQSLLTTDLDLLWSGEDPGAGQARGGLGNFGGETDARACDRDRQGRLYLTLTPEARIEGAGPDRASRQGPIS